MRNAPFRFAVMAAPMGDGESWLATARRAEQLGYTALFSPDGPHLNDPMLALASVAAATTRLRVGTFVLAAPLRQPGLTAWQARSLSALTGGRFDFGIGTGLPSFEPTVREWGMAFGSPGERLSTVADVIDRLRALESEGARTPVLMAAGGPRSRALAAAKADIVTFGTSPLTGRDEFADLVADVDAHAGTRADEIEHAMNLFVIGDEVPAQLAGFIGASAAELIAADSLAMLRGSVAEMCDELQRRRERFGASYILVNSVFVEQFAPVVERLAGQ